ncbi:hypothetical protein PFISCL1PPCAC_21731 [Pristionchus fissidentatus]|uniref:Hydrolase n=1 Tax=Pristionchus fissidentatus TaxID=1538716 RepID=A0AAV5WI80_9BILA|nr:hypothetical protein PFISCL1PPCAC_21731 [Pristionchus fissidentatus]
MPEFHPVTHVVFDFDGLLVDTEKCYTEALSRMLAPFGKQFTMQTKSAMMGMKMHDSVEWLINHEGLKEQVTPDAFIKDYVVHLEELLRNGPLLPGAEKVVRHLAKHTNNRNSAEVPMAICTGSNTTEFAQKSAKSADLWQLIPIKVLTGDDPLVKNGKPHPDPYIETMKRFPAPPAHAKHVLVLEDAPNGVKSGLAAGCQVVQVPTGPEPCFRMGAEIDAKITVLPSLLDLDLTVFGLPAFD